MNAIPSTMWAVQAPVPGGPEALRRVEQAVPRPRESEVLIKMFAAGMSRGDVMQREGRHPPPAGESPTLGLELSGEIVAVGEGVTRWKPGDLVCALVAGGAYAQFCVAHEALVFPVPRGLGLSEAAAVPESAVTVWANVFTMGQLHPGDDLLVHGGASSIGTTAIQLAHAWGARVFATAGGPVKCELCRQLGASEAIDYHTRDFVKEIERATAGRGVDVVLDMVGGDYFARNMQVAAMDARIVSIGFMRGATAQVDFGPMVRKRLTLTGSGMRGRTLQQKSEIVRQVATQLWPLWDSGRLKPWIHATFAMTDVVQAHALMESGAHAGKILLLAD